jgi:hypothetical protein
MRHSTVMRDDRWWLLVFAVGCGSSEGSPSTGLSGAAGNAGGGFAGAMPTGGLAGASHSGGSSTGGAQAQGGTTGGLGNGGAGPNNSGGNGGSGASKSTNGGISGGPSGGSGGRGSGGRGAGGPSTGGRAQNAGAGSGGAPANGGTGGCVQNLACELDPPPSTGDLHQDCVDRINQFRTQCACLPPLARRTDGEACANQMAEYDAGKGTAHAGANDRICQPGGAQNECPGYRSNAEVISLCLQQMWDEGPPPTDPCEGSCFQEYGHFINMTDPSSTRVACGFFTTSAGKVWAVQNFSR